MLQGQEMSGEVPESIGNLTHLKYLFAALTGMMGATLLCCSWCPHTHRDLSSNKLTGTVPQSLGNLKDLTVLFGECYFAPQEHGDEATSTVDTGD